MKHVLGIISANYRFEDLDKISGKRPLGAVPIFGRYRLIDFALSAMTNSGIRTVGVIAPNQYRSLIDHIGSGKPWGLERKSQGLFILPCSTSDLQFKMYKFPLINFLNNIEILKRHQGDTVLITGCNNVYNLDFTEMVDQHMASNSDITLAYKRHNHGLSNDTLSIELDDKGFVTGYGLGADEGHESLEFADVFVMKKALLIDILENSVNAAFTDLFDVVAANAVMLKVSGYEIKGFFSCVKTLDKYFKLNMDILDCPLRDELFASKNPIYTKTKDNAPTKFTESSNVTNAVVSSGCIIEGEVSDSIIFRDCIVEEGASIRNSIIMQRCIIEKNVRLENVIIDKGMSIASGATIVGTKEKPFVLQKGMQL